MGSEVSHFVKAQLSELGLEVLRLEPPVDYRDPGVLSANAKRAAEASLFEGTSVGCTRFNGF